MPTANPSGYLYPANASGKTYISLFYHRDGTDGKSQWVISVDEEHNTFCTSDRCNFIDANSDYWGCIDRGITVIGESGERICKFEKPSNVNDPWHGYPTSIASIAVQRSPDRQRDILIATNMLMQMGAIDVTIAKRIQRGKL